MLRAKAEGCTLVFLDPDNGLEVKSKPVGRKGSSKYVAWSEIEAVWKGEASILIYQHFPRRERAPFIESRLEELRERLKAPVALAFATAHVAFFLVAQPKHSHWFREAADRVASMWRDQIRIVRST